MGFEITPGDGFQTHRQGMAERAKHQFSIVISWATLVYFCVSFRPIAFKVKADSVTFVVDDPMTLKLST